MAFTLVRQDNANIGTGAGPFSFVLGAAPAAGDVIVFAADVGNITHDPAATLSQTGVVWTKIRYSNVNFGNTTWFGVASAGAGATITVTPAGAGLGGIFCHAATWSGGPSSLLAGQFSATSGTSATPTSPSATPVTGHQSLVIALMRRGSTYVSGPTNGFTEFVSGSALFRIAYLVTSAGGATSTAWTFNSSAVWDTQIYVLEGTSYTLAAALGAFADTGNAAALVAARRLASGTGTVALSGPTTALVAARRFAAATGTITLSGLVTVVRTARRLAALAGAGTVSGITTALSMGRWIRSAVAQFLATGQPVTLTSSGASGPVTLTLAGTLERLDTSPTLQCLSTAPTMTQLETAPIVDWLDTTPTLTRTSGP